MRKRTRLSAPTKSPDEQSARVSGPWMADQKAASQADSRHHPSLVEHLVQPPSSPAWPGERWSILAKTAR